jgi:pimeloyl-ACP methyl ester carboxylesterase
MAVQTVTSRDGTKIAYDKLGKGAPVILINGALSAGAASAGLARLLAPHFMVYSYDRRGRGGSGNTSPYAVEREIEDVEVLIDEAGGVAHLVGFSSGAALALETASALGPKVKKLAIYEAPYDSAAGAAGKWKKYKAEQARPARCGPSRGRGLAPSEVRRSTRRGGDRDEGIAGMGQHGGDGADAAL